MPSHAPPTPRKSTRTRAGAGNTTTNAAKTRDHIGLTSLALPKIKPDALPINRTKNASSTKASVRSVPDELSEKREVGRLADRECGHEPTVDVLTNGIQNISINSKRPLKKVVPRGRSKHAPGLLSDVKEAPIPLAEQISLAMKSVNSNLSKLSSIRQSGWKADVDLPNKRIPEPNGLKSRPKDAASASDLLKIDEALETINRCYSALHTLRKLISGSAFKNKAYDIERAGLALVNHSIELRLYNPALRLLEISHSYLQALVFPSSPTPLLHASPKTINASPISMDAWDSCSKVLTFSMPKNHHPEIIPSLKDVALLLMTAVAQAFQAFLKANTALAVSSARGSTLNPSTSTTTTDFQAARIRADCCHQALESTDSISHWIAFVTGDGTSIHDGDELKKILSAAQASYTSTIKACVTWEDLLEPQLLFQLRQSAILSLLTCQAHLKQLESIDTLMDQVRRALLLYARSCPGQIKDVVSDARVCFTRIVQTIQSHQSHDQVCVAENSGWIGLCEVVVGLARKVPDLELVDQVIPFLNLTQDTGSEEPKAASGRQQDKQAPRSEHHTGLLLANLTTTTSLLDHHLKTGEDRDTACQLQKSILTIAALVHRGSASPIELRHKSSIVVDRLRRACARVIRQTNAEDKKNPCTEGIRVACCSVSRAIVDGWNQEIMAEPEMSSQPASDIAIRSMMISGSVETLINLSEYAFRVDSPDSHQEVLEYLSRCEPLIKLLPEPDVSIVRCLTSAYYNAGVSLYHADKLAMAMHFVRPSCELPNIMFNFHKSPAVKARWNEYEDLDGELETLQKQLVKRWELLALCYLQIDKPKSHQAYISAILSHRLADFDCLGKLAGESADVQYILNIAPGIYKLVQRATRLATWDIFLPDTKCSLMESLLSIRLPDSDLGAILELQLQYIYQNTRKGECRLVIKTILDDCLKVYNSTEYPLRRARVLNRLMEWHVCMSLDAKSNSTYQTLEQLLAEVSKLVQRDDYGLDDALKPFAMQHLALGHVWLALAAQSRNSHNAFIEASETALEKFEAIPLPQVPSQRKSRVTDKKSGSKPKPPLNHKAHTQSRTRASSVKATKNNPTPTTPINQRAPHTYSAYKTPEQNSDLKSSQLLQHSGKKSLNGTCKVVKQCPLDDLDRHIQHLKLFAHVLGAHGLISLKLRVLRFLQQLGPAHAGQSSSDSKEVENYVSTTVELASTYMQFEEYGHSSTLLSEANRAIQSSSLQSVQSSLASESLILLLYSRCFSEADDMESAVSSFTLAREKWASAVEEDDYCSRNSEVSSTQKVIKRTKALQMIALASFTHSHLQERQGNLTLAIESATRAVRSVHRASSNILRISSPAPEKASYVPGDPMTDVFSSDKKAQDCVPLPEVTRDPQKPHVFTIESHPIGELTWQLASLIPVLLIRAINLYIDRGSPRIAEGYLAQLLAIADQIGSRRLKVSGMAIKAKILLLKREFDAAQAILKEAFTTLDDEPGSELAEIWKLKCELSYKTGAYDEANASCAEMVRMLKRLDRSCASILQSTSPAKSLRFSTQSSQSPEEPPIVSSASLIPLVIAAQVTKIQVLVSRAIRRPEPLSHALRVLSKMPSRAREKVFESTLIAMLQLDDVLQNFRVDPMLGVLPEAMIVISQGCSGSDKMNHRNDEFPQLSKTLKLMHEVVSNRIIGSADIPNLCETIHTLVTLKFITCILQRTAKNAAGEVAALLDFASSLTIRREMIESIRNKLRSLGPTEDMNWPSEMEDADLPRLFDKLQIGKSSDSDQQHWQQVATHHQSDSDSPTTYRPLKALPSGWRVVSIHLAFDQNSLFLIRHDDSCNPLVVKLPMDRFSRREGEDELFTLPVALKELQTIVSQSNAATQRARHVSGHDEKVQWWQERKELDTRMRVLVENIENNWLGACKGLLRCCNKTADIPAVREALGKVFRRHLISSQDKHGHPEPLDEHLIHSFMSLPMNCRDEDLEDLVQFAVDSYHIHEAPVVGDEVDADQVVCELRDIQKDLLEPYSNEENAQQHLFLILDKKLVGFPWEVLPILAGHSVSRIPSLSFLRDRLVDVTSSSTLDSTRTSYILNPSGDLTNTQSQFETWLEGNRTWNGIKGRSPSSEEVKRALLSSDVMLYFGHGGAEQYIRSSTIKQLPRCAVTMLWGCSSGMLQDQGDFDPTGTPYAYMLAGCPSLLANLWDVTDKDIDKLAVDLFKKTGLYPDGDPKSDPMTLTSALAQSRSSCQLRYLNGAAPVVYGIPVRFTSPICA